MLLSLAALDIPSPSVLGPVQRHPVPFLGHRHACLLAHRCLWLERFAVRAWYLAPPKPLKARTRPSAPRCATTVVTATVDGPQVIDVLALGEVEEAVDLVEDVRSWVRRTSLPGAKARLRDAGRVLADLEAPAAGWLDAVEVVVSVAVEAGMPAYGTPAALVRLAALVLDRELFPERAVVRRARRRPYGHGLEARLDEVRRLADARLTAAGSRRLPRGPAKTREADRRAALSGRELRERSAA